MEAGLALVLKQLPDEDKLLQIEAVPLAELVGCTMELIGTNVNANPYKLGSKQKPIHVLVRHGSIPFGKSPPISYEDLKRWFSEDPEGQCEGIVWHCSNGNMFKVHRHHLGLNWPVENASLANWPTRISVDISKYEDIDPTTNIFKLSQLNGQQFESLSYINLD